MNILHMTESQYDESFHFCLAKQQQQQSNNDNYIDFYRIKTFRAILHIKNMVFVFHKQSNIFKANI